jgi:hypothetical protein
MPEAKPSLAGALLLLVMIAGGITGLMWEVFAFARKRTFLSPARFAWRIVSWILIIAVFFGMFAGMYLLRFPETPFRCSLLVFLPCVRFPRCGFSRCHGFSRLALAHERAIQTQG